MVAKVRYMTDELIKSDQRQFLERCKQSVTYFIQTCCMIQHPSIGILNFRLFSYQKKCLADFRKHRYNIFLKCRQSGISTLTGAYALWFAMFHGNKKILIVSKRDLDAKDFLYKNVQLIYDHLPEWMKQIWAASIRNEHELGFTNGSLIRSLTASKDTLRSNASSLNIIDESGFIAEMEDMWSGGWSTLQHGGNVIVISTPNGVGNWYWSTWTEAVDGLNDFNPIRIHWYDMDWHLEYIDPIRKVNVRIAPTDGIRETKGKEEIERYGDYWSPWLEGEYRGLQRKGESHKFKQEVLAEFIGSGGTILNATTLKRIEAMVKQYADQHEVVTELISYIHPVTGEEEYLDLKGTERNEGLWVWNKPFHPVPPIMKGSRVLEPGIPGHTYAMGVDVATGKNNDYSTVEIFDVDTMEQVAEFMGRVPPNIFCKIVDYLGRWYNNAIACIDRTGGLGSDLVDDLQELLYPNIWRKNKVQPGGGIQYGPFGFAITESSKPTLNKALIQYISENDGEGYTLKSTRLWKQCQIYIRKRNRQGFDTGKVGAQDGKGNYDDLVCAAGLGFIAIGDIVDQSPQALIPTRSSRVGAPDLSVVDRAQQQTAMITRNDPNVLLPYSPIVETIKSQTIEHELNNYTSQLTRPLQTKEEMKANLSIIATRKYPTLIPFRR